MFQIMIALKPFDFDQQVSPLVLQYIAILLIGAASLQYTSLFEPIFVPASFCKVFVAFPKLLSWRIEPSQGHFGHACDAHAWRSERWVLVSPKIHIFRHPWFFTSKRFTERPVQPLKFYLWYLGNDPSLT